MEKCIRSSEGRAGGGSGRVREGRCKENGRRMKKGEMERRRDGESGGKRAGRGVDM